MLLQYRPFSISRHMPPSRAQPPSIIYSIPIVQSTKLNLRLYFVTRIYVWRPILTLLIPLAIEARSTIGDACLILLNVLD